MKWRFLWAGIMMLACVCASAAELYRWVDESGKVHYSDIPAVDATGAEKKKFNSQEDIDAGLSYESRRAKQNFPVTLHVSEDCGDICQQARDFLRKRGIPFVEKILKSQEDLDAFKQISGTDSVPTLAVGKTWLKGFQAQQWNNELDIAGYPKSSAKP